MENIEKKNIEKNQVKEIEKQNVNEIDNIVVLEETKTKFYVEREKFVATDGNEYNSYFLRGSVRGRDVKVDFSPKDSGGYEVLDIVFGSDDKAELIVKREENTDSAGRKTRYTSYLLRTSDNDGVYDCSVKPARDSDKSLLRMILRPFGIEIV